jgi:hypothetical protein
MRTVGVVVGLIALVLGSSVARADDVFRWRDGDGQMHFSNVPSPGAQPLAMESDDGAIGTASARPTGSGAAEAGIQGAPAAMEADSAFSTSASLRRQQLERDLRDTKRRMKALDDQIGSLARVRTQNAAGSVSTGGVRANATEVRADEEKSLSEQREQLKAHETEVRGAYTQLHDEVTSRLGGVPDWWIEVR